MRAPGYFFIEKKEFKEGGRLRFLFKTRKNYVDITTPTKKLNLIEFIKIWESKNKKNQLHVVSHTQQSEEIEI